MVSYLGVLQKPLPTTSQRQYGRGLEVCIFTYTWRGSLAPLEEALLAPWLASAHWRWEYSDGGCGVGFPGKRERGAKREIRVGAFQCSAWDVDAVSSPTCATLTSPRYGGWGRLLIFWAFPWGPLAGFRREHPGHPQAFYGPVL